MKNKINIYNVLRLIIILFLLFSYVSFSCYAYPKAKVNIFFHLFFILFSLLLVILGFIFVFFQYKIMRSYSNISFVILKVFQDIFTLFFAIGGTGCLISIFLGFVHFSVGIMFLGFGLGGLLGFFILQRHIDKKES